jgi:hypothetical protein
MALTAIKIGPYTIKHLPVNQAADTGPTALVAEQAGSRICIVRYHLQATPGGSFALLSAAQALTNALPMAATSGFTAAAVAVLRNELLPVLWTEPSEALNLTTVTAACTGWIQWYYWNGL